MKASSCERTGGSLLLFWVFIAFMIISAFCLLNMLIGVLCEVIDDSAAQESEITQIKELKKNMSEAFLTIDTSKDGLITPQEWMKMKDQPTVRASMANLGVEEQHIKFRLDQMQESLFGDYDADDNSARHGLTFAKFIEKVMEIRPDTDASALDIEILRVRVEREERNFNARLDFIEQALTNVNALPEALPTDTKQPSTNTKSSPAVKGEVVDPKISSSTSWLREVPTEVLFAVLNSRAPPDPTPPKLLTESR